MPRKRRELTESDQTPKVCLRECVEGTSAHEAQQKWKKSFERFKLSNFSERN